VLECCRYRSSKPFTRHQETRGGLATVTAVKFILVVLLLAFCLWLAVEILFTTASFIIAAVLGKRQRREDTSLRLQPGLVAREFIEEIGAAALTHLLVMVAEGLHLPRRKLPLNVTTTPILLIPGYFSNRAYWLAFARIIRRVGAAQFYTIDPKPMTGDIRELARQVAERVDVILGTTGSAHVNIVCHSMGGLIARYYIEQLQGADKVGTCVMMGTPHHGTWLSRLGVGTNAKQMRPGSEFLADLNKFEHSDKGVKYVNIYSTFDNMLVPPNNAVLGGNAKNIPIDHVGHLTMLYSPKVAKLAWQNLRE
jgi:triacylglycerol esterase/lipase EstA (alpha/beta hydrolase family)